MPLIQVSAMSKHENAQRPAYVNVGSIAYVTTAGEKHDPDGHAAIVLVGGLSQPSERLVCRETVAEVMALIAAATV